MSPTDRDRALDAAVAEVRARYVAGRPASLAAHGAASRHLPGGNTRTVLHFDPCPFRVRRGWGPMLEDVDGHQYLDLLGEYTAGLFGHSNPAIRAAITSALDDGLSFGAHNIHEARLAELICSRFPSIDLVRFTNSGTEANLMNVALARVATGRESLLVFRGGYHGGVLSWVTGPSPVNVPFPAVIGTYNDVDGTRELIHRHGPELAAVLVEPMLGSAGCIPATPEFLTMLREETIAAGALLVFDEVMTSRLSTGGAQQRYGVRPDLTSLGKYLGGGLSFGAFGGRRELMERFDPSRPGAIGHAGTFNNNVLSMAAGVAGLTQVLTSDALTELNGRGDRLREGLNDVFARVGSPFGATGIGSLLNVHATPALVRSPHDLAGADDRAKEILFFDLLERGIYLARRGFVALSLEIDDAHVATVLDAVRDVLRERPCLRS
jgi:glutamate-1-semialdehyde 2,1-aminomutase